MKPRIEAPSYGHGTLTVDGGGFAPNVPFSLTVTFILEFPFTTMSSLPIAPAGTTSGDGSFHVSLAIDQLITEYLKRQNEDTPRPIQRIWIVGAAGDVWSNTVMKISS